METPPKIPQPPVHSPSPRRPPQKRPIYIPINSSRRQDSECIIYISIDTKVMILDASCLDPVNKYFSLPCTNPGGHVAQLVPVQVCVYVCMHMRVCACAWCACACTCMCASVVRHCCVRRPPNFIFAKPQKPRSLWINVYFTILISRRRAKNIIYLGIKYRTLPYSPYWTS